VAEFLASIDIEAAPEEVFEFLVTPEGMVTWMGEYAELEPVPGGAFAVNIAGYPVRGEYLEVRRPESVVFSWGHSGDEEFPPGLSRVAFTLTAIEIGTRVDLRHSGLPEGRTAGHEAGWRHFMPRLAAAAAGRVPGPDDWVPRPG
jgi:uncharacterized protein YndB with AHSA1/START domain